MYPIICLTYSLSIRVEEQVCKHVSSRCVLNMKRLVKLVRFNMIKKCNLCYENGQLQLCTLYISLFLQSVGFLCFGDGSWLD